MGTEDWRNRHRTARLGLTCYPGEVINGREVTSDTQEGLIDLLAWPPYAHRSDAAERPESPNYGRFQVPGEYTLRVGDLEVVRRSRTRAILLVLLPARSCQVLDVVDPDPIRSRPYQVHAWRCPWLEYGITLEHVLKWSDRSGSRLFQPSPMALVRQLTRPLAELQAELLLELLESENDG